MAVRFLVRVGGGTRIAVRTRRTGIAGNRILIAFAVGWASAVCHGQTFAYVPNGSSNNISAYSVNAASGALTPVPGSPFAAGAGPFGAAVSPSQRFLYVSNYACQSGCSAPSTVSGYSIDASTGVLTPVPGSPFPAGIGPHSIAIAPDGRFLYVVKFDLIDATPAGAADLPSMIKAGIVTWVLPRVRPQETVVLSYKARLRPTVPIGVQVRGPSCFNALTSFVAGERDLAKQIFHCTDAETWSTYLVCTPACATLGNPVLVGICEAGCATKLFSDIRARTTDPACMLAASEARATCVNATINAFNCGTADLFSRAPVDPNEKLTSRPTYIRLTETLTFPIHYENIGNAEAKDIFITDVLDQNLDISTLELHTPGALFDQIPER